MDVKPCLWAAATASPDSYPTMGSFGIALAAAARQPGQASPRSPSVVNKFETSTATGLRFEDGSGHDSWAGQELVEHAAVDVAVRSYRRRLPAASTRHDKVAPRHRRVSAAAGDARQLDATAPQGLQSAVKQASGGRSTTSRWR